MKDGKKASNTVVKPCALVGSGPLICQDMGHTSTKNGRLQLGVRTLEGRPTYLGRHDKHLKPTVARLHRRDVRVIAAAKLRAFGHPKMALALVDLDRF